ncbi:minor capsid protein [uncultured Weissella sp.]|uniref:minor capsid protein n=1 Tax=Weissella viridescens TaxID=1629 RepID=UPI0027DE631E|nr:minor capsid protein [uncultured Weissella sp.]
MPVTVNVDGLNSRFSEHNIAKARYVAANQAMINMNQYVPYSGENGHQDHLRDTGHVASDGQSVTWTTAYAHSIFLGLVGGKYPIQNYTTPGTSKRWDLRMTGNRQDMLEVTNAFKETLMKG